ncbi:Transporter, MotA/TolQ/ExbB proton channel family protein [Treponema phagedenis]|uniref:Transporter, MotA/TolQ/ExbB proton channel family protein n=2 Tax=Treponema phagedenis TaxID=162 RepID=A0A0B7H2Q2_TREPH|nr:Transporter, MotA/TolQ/ExbB proton channel family protein [Treponema phagedenis]
MILGGFFVNGLYYFINLMQKGKTVNYIIIGLYLIALAAAAERVVYYVSTRYKRKQFRAVLALCETAAVNKTDLQEDFFDQKGLSGSCISAVAHIFFQCRTADAQYTAEAFERTVQYILTLQEKGFILLSRIAAVAPLLGLLGTVTGLMAAFQKIAVLGGSVDIAILSSGIWEAMITTATGLVTAIFAFAFYEFFDWLNTQRVRDMEQLVSVLMSYQQQLLQAGSTDETV